VLETDAPFLSPVSCCEVNHPWNLRTVAVAVSQCRNIPLNVLLWMVNDNALKFYDLPHRFKMADKLVTWVFALQFSDNFIVLWNEIKKIIHIYMLRTILSTSYGNFMLNIWTLNS
jgi:hypothetical protein